MFLNGQKPIVSINKYVSDSLTVLLSFGGSKWITHTMIHFTHIVYR